MEKKTEEGSSQSDQQQKIYVAKIKLTPPLIEELKKSGGKLSGNVRDIMKMDRQYNDLLTIRGKAIDKSLEIERQLEFLISSLLFENKVNRKNEAKFFENFILNTPHLTFASKLKIFRSLYKTCSYLIEKGGESSTLATNLKKVMEVRDNFAHGGIFFKDVKPPIIPYLFYYKENEPKEQKLDNEYFNGVNELYVHTLSELVNLRKHISESFKNKKEIKWKI